MAILRVTPEKLKESISALAELSADIRCVVNKCNLLLENTDSQWEGERQESFKIYACKLMNDMQQFAAACDEYARDIDEIANEYLNVECSLVNNISRNLLDDIIL